MEIQLLHKDAHTGLAHIGMTERRQPARSSRSAQDELTGNYTASITDYEAIHLHILALADLLSSGIMHQFPSRFA